MGAILACVVLDGRISKSSVEREFRHLHYAAPPAETPYDGTWRMLDYLQEVEDSFDNLDVATDYIFVHSEKWYFGLMMKVKNLRAHPNDPIHYCVGWYDENGDFAESYQIPETAIARDKNGYFWLFGGLLAC